MRSARISVTVALAAAILLTASPVPQANEANGNYDAYAADVEALKDRMLAWCRNHRGAIDREILADRKGDTPGFRSACGEKLNARPVPGHEDVRLFYFRQLEDAGGLEYFGVRRDLTFNGDPYVLVTAWLIRTGGKDGQGTGIAQNADAFLMGLHQGAWRTAWRYVDLDEPGWRRAANDNVGANVLSPELETFIDRVWRDEVIAATAELRATVETGGAELIPATP